MIVSSQGKGKINYSDGQIMPVLTDQNCLITIFEYLTFKGYYEGKKIGI